MVSRWMCGIINHRNCLIEERNKLYTMTLLLSPKVDLEALTSMFENQFLSWMRAKSHFHIKMLRPRQVPLTMLFLKSCVLLLMKNAWKKEVLEKDSSSFQNHIVNYDNVIQWGLNWFKPTSYMGLNWVSGLKFKSPGTWSLNCNLNCVPGNVVYILGKGCLSSLLHRPI